MPYRKKKRTKPVGFDVFFCHNSDDRLSVARIARELKNVVVWLHGLTNGNSGQAFRFYLQ